MAMLLNTVLSSSIHVEAISWSAVANISLYGAFSEVAVFADHANGDQEDEEGVRHYKRGLAPYTFVAWDHLLDSILNLPVHKMDFYVAG